MTSGVRRSAGIAATTDGEVARQTISEDLEGSGRDWPALNGRERETGEDAERLDRGVIRNLLSSGTSYGSREGKKNRLAIGLEKDS